MNLQTTAEAIVRKLFYNDNKYIDLSGDKRVDIVMRVICKTSPGMALRGLGE